MGDDITGLFASGKTLKLLQQSKMFSIEANDKEPNQWPVTHFANVGTSEDFVVCSRMS